MSQGPHFILGHILDNLSGGYMTCTGEPEVWHSSPVVRDQWEPNIQHKRVFGTYRGTLTAGNSYSVDEDVDTSSFKRQLFEELEASASFPPEDNYPSVTILEGDQITGPAINAASGGVLVLRGALVHIPYDVVFSGLLIVEGSNVEIGGGAGPNLTGKMLLISGENAFDDGVRIAIYTGEVTPQAPFELEPRECSGELHFITYRQEIQSQSESTLLSYGEVGVEVDIVSGTSNCVTRAVVDNYSGPAQDPYSGNVWDTRASNRRHISFSTSVEAVVESLPISQPADSPLQSIVTASANRTADQSYSNSSSGFFGSLTSGPIEGPCDRGPGITWSASISSSCNAQFLFSGALNMGDQVIAWERNYQESISGNMTTGFEGARTTSSWFYVHIGPPLISWPARVISTTPQSVQEFLSIGGLTVSLTALAGLVGVGSTLFSDDSSTAEFALSGLAPEIVLERFSRSVVVTFGVHCRGGTIIAFSARKVDGQDWVRANPSSLHINTMAQNNSLRVPLSSIYPSPSDIG